MSISHTTVLGLGHGLVLTNLTLSHTLFPKSETIMNFIIEIVLVEYSLENPELKFYWSPLHAQQASSACWR